MSTLHDHAERELRAAGFYEPDSDYGGMLPEAVLELVDVFSKQGHSGMSASIVRQLFNTLIDFKPLSPIKGDTEEWGLVDEQNQIYQNKRLSSLFKDGENGKPYYLDAVVFQGEDPHDRFTGKVEGITSRQYVKLPFTPKTYVVGVEKDYAIGEPADKEKFYEEKSGDGSVRYYQYRIKQKEILHEVYGHYEKPEEAASPDQEKEVIERTKE